MINFQLAVYKLISQEYELSRFKEWVYSNKELEEILNPEEYLELISLNYEIPSSLYKAKKILIRQIDIGKYYEWFLRQILQKIIDRPSDVNTYIEQCYDLYCRGFGFLDNLGISYGLLIKVPPSNYNADNWNELTSSEQSNLIDHLYPAVAEEAKKVLDWFDNGKIVIIGDDAKDQIIEYDDNRSVDKE